MSTKNWSSPSEQASWSHLVHFHLRLLRQHRVCTQVANEPGQRPYCGQRQNATAANLVRLLRAYRLACQL